jgi:hypothetical protein
VTIRAVWLPSLELALANLFYSLAHIRFQPGIVQEAQGRSAETAVSPHYNYQSTVYKSLKHLFFKLEIQKLGSAKYTF